MLMYITCMIACVQHPLHNHHYIRTEHASEFVKLSEHTAHKDSSLPMM